MNVTAIEKAPNNFGKRYSWSHCARGDEFNKNVVGMLKGIAKVDAANGGGRDSGGVSGASDKMCAMAGWLAGRQVKCRHEQRRNVFLNLAVGHAYLLV